MTDNTDREPRDPRGSDDPRDARDARESDDPRDARDPRQPGDPRLGDEGNGVPRFVKALAAGIAVGLAAVAFVAWQLAELRATEERREFERTVAVCERAVAGRDDNRAVWLYLVARDPERRDDPDVVAFVAFLNDRLPPLTCEGNVPTPIPASTISD